MRSAIQMILDDDAAAQVDALCAPLQGNSNFETERGLGEVPHITFALYTDLDPARFTAERLAAFAATVGPVSVTLRTLGIVPGPKIMVALLPIVTEPLLALHRRFHETFAEFDTWCSPNGKPGQFAPNVTLALNIEGADHVRGVFDQVIGRIQPITARFVRLRYLTVRPVDVRFEGALGLA